METVDNPTTLVTVLKVFTAAAATAIFNVPPYSASARMNGVKVTNSALVKSLPDI